MPTCTECKKVLTETEIQRYDGECMECWNDGWDEAEARELELLWEKK